METKIRSKHVPMAEQIKLINECRRSGLSDADWCREHNISQSTFYSWVKRCRNASMEEHLPPPSYGRMETARPTQDVVPVSIVPERTSEHVSVPCLPPADTLIDNSHTIEVVMKDVTIRIKNDANPDIIGAMFRVLKEGLC